MITSKGTGRGIHGSTVRWTTVAARHAAGRWTADGGRCSGRRYGRERCSGRRHGRGRCSGRQHLQGHRAEDERYVHTGSREKTEMAGRKTRVSLKRLREESSRDLGGEHPYLCQPSLPRRLIPTCFPHVKIPRGSPRFSSALELHVALPAPGLHVALNSPDIPC